jgi:Uma2 family endonuclease
MEAKKYNKVTIKEYLKIEKDSNVRHEFHDGLIFALAGGTIEHGLIAGNIFIELGLALRENKKDRRPINSEVKLNISKLNKYLYPDVMVICGDIEKSTENPASVSNPIVIIEVLSKSTEGYDRGDKFFFYKQIQSLQEYILIDQYQPSIDRYSKKNDLWQITRVEGLEEHLLIPILGANIKLKNIYKDVF